MSSSWIRAALKYSLMLAPTALLVALLAIVWVATGVAQLLRDPSGFRQAPVLVQKSTKAAYWHTRKHWQTVPECVLFDRELLYRPRPGSCRFENSEFSTTMTFDEAGARRTPAPAAGAGDSPPRPRLVIVGDSHAMGWGVEDDETFASVLSRDYGYPTVNFAVSSYATDRELLRLRRDFQFAPDDILVIQYCDNDLEENRHFASVGSVGPYEQKTLDAMTHYQPVKQSALPIAGLIVRMLWSDLLTRTAVRRRGAEVGIDPTDAFLSVLRAFPEQTDRRVLVLAINGPGLGTHLLPHKLATERLPLIVPVLAPEDYFDIDDHMLPRGHRAVAAAIDAAVRALGPTL